MDTTVTLPILSPISYFNSIKDDNKNNSDVMYFKILTVKETATKTIKQDKQEALQKAYVRVWYCGRDEFANPTPKSFIANQASFPARKRELLKSIF